MPPSQAEHKRKVRPRGGVQQRVKLGAHRLRQEMVKEQKRRGRQYNDYRSN